VDHDPHRRHSGGQRKPHPAPQPEPSRVRRLAKKPIAWICGLITVGAGAFVVQIATKAASDVTQPAAATGAPARLDLERVVPRPGESYVSADTAPLTSAEFGQLNALSQADPGYHDWLTAHGLVPMGAIKVEFVIEGNRSHTVRVVDIRPVMKCADPLTGTLFESSSSGIDMTTQLFVDLDSPNAPLAYITTAANGDTTRGTDFFGTNTVSLAPGEQYTFDVLASTATHYCTFTLAMTTLDGDKTVMETLDDRGKPFGISAQTKNAVGYSVKYVGGLANPQAGPTSYWARADPAS
jgi:hypothetical protein